MLDRSDLLYTLLTELHAAIKARNWRDEDVLDLANVIIARGSVPPAGIIGPLTARMRVANGVRVADITRMAQEAYAAAIKRQGLLDRSSGRSAPARSAKSSTENRLLAIKVKITDGEALGRLDERTIAAYLTNRGWHRAPDEHWPKRRLGSIWHKGDAQLLLPTGAAADRVLRLAELVATLSAVEDRSQLLIYRDLGG